MTINIHFLFLHVCKLFTFSFAAYCLCSSYSIIYFQVLAHRILIFWKIPLRSALLTVFKTILLLLIWLDKLVFGFS